MINQLFLYFYLHYKAHVLFVVFVDTLNLKNYYFFDILLYLNCCIHIVDVLIYYHSFCIHYYIHIVVEELLDTREVSAYKELFVFLFHWWVFSYYLSFLNALCHSLYWRFFQYLHDWESSDYTWNRHWRLSCLYLYYRVCRGHSVAWS